MKHQEWSTWEQAEMFLKSDFVLLGTKTVTECVTVVGIVQLRRLDWGLEVGWGVIVLAELLQNEQVKKCEHVKAVFIYDVQNAGWLIFFFKKAIRIYVFYIEPRKQWVDYLNCPVSRVAWMSCRDSQSQTELSDTTSFCVTFLLTYFCLQV